MPDRLLPESWVKCELGEVITYGASKQATPDEFKPDDWLLELEDIEKDTSKILKRITVSVRNPKSNKNRFLPGDVLYGKLRPYLNKVVIADQEGLCTTEIIPLTPGLVEGRYLFYWLKSLEFTSYVNSVSHGLRMPRLGTKQAKAAPFVLPPSAEQTRIANKLDELLAQVDTIKARVDAIPGILKRFRQSVLAAAVSGRLTEEWRQSNQDVEPAEVLLDKVLIERKANWNHKGKYKEPLESAVDLFPALPASWTCASLDALVNANRPICYGILMPKENLRDGVLYVKVRDMKGEVINLEGLQRTSPEIAQKYERSSLVSGDILLSIRGTYGRVVEVPDELEGGNITQDSARLAICDQVDHRFIIHALRSNPLQKHFQSVARGVAVKGVNIGDVRPTPIPLPPYLEQLEIDRQVAILLNFADQIEQRVNDSQSGIDSLTQSILAKAFRGELVPQDPGDEPASVLLERIRGEQTRRTGNPKIAKRSKRASQPTVATEI